MDNKNNDDKQTVYIKFDKNDSSVSSFISYLTAAFKRRGIFVLLDDESSDWLPQLRVFVVVFSKNYPNSISFLEEFVNIFKYSQRNSGFKVVPVFYGVSSSSLKQDMENFGGAFGAFKKFNSEDEMIRLLETVVLPGHDNNNDLSESEFIEEIVSDVFERLYPTEQIGIYKHIHKIENLLCKQSWGLRTIGISGESGIGKTTLAQAAYLRMLSGYDISRFIENFHREYNTKELEPLSNDYFTEIPMEQFDLNTSDLDPPSYRRKRLLIVLDDVQNARDAERFLAGFDQFGAGSLIIVTSREKQVLEACCINEIYELKGLDDEDSLKLFTRCVFGEDVIEQNLLKKIESFHGNPAEIRSYAKELKGKTVVEMGTVLTKPKIHPILDVLRTGHDPCCNTEKDMCIVPYEKDQPHDNKELTLYHDPVLAIKDTHTAHEFLVNLEKNPRFYLSNRVPKSLHRDLKVPYLHYNYVRSLLQHLHHKHNALLQRFATQLHKPWLSFSKSFKTSRVHSYPSVKLEISDIRNDIDQLEYHLQLSLDHSDQGCNVIKDFLEVVKKIRELNPNQDTSVTEIRSETKELLKIEYDLDLYFKDMDQWSNI